MNKTPWNVLFIMADQQRADSIGPGHHPFADFPNMERLRDESVHFTQFYTAAMACGPSRNCFLTGLSPWRTGVSNARFNMHGAASWMSALHERGYLSLSTGKTHLIHSGSYHAHIELGESFGDQGGWDHFRPEATPEERARYFDIATTDKACDILGKLSAREPFAMFVGFHAPHEPYVMPEEYLDFCRPEQVELPASAIQMESRPAKSDAYQQRVDHFKKRLGHPINDNEIRSGIAGHHCLVKMVDDCLGQILETLEATGLSRNTLVVYTADHGDVLGEYRIFNKAATFHDSEVRVPMLMRFPDGRHAGQRIEDFASSIDFFPTIFDMLDMKVDCALPGVSLRPALENRGAVRDHVTCAIPNGGMMYRTGDWKLWLHPDGDGEMYHIAEDPLEMHNCFQDPAHAEKRYELTQALLLSRMKDDSAANAMTRQETLLREAVSLTNEPEVPMIPRRRAD